MKTNDSPWCCWFIRDKSRIHFLVPPVTVMKALKTAERKGFCERIPFCVEADKLV